MYSVVTIGVAMCSNQIEVEVDEEKLYTCSLLGGHFQMCNGPYTYTVLVDIANKEIGYYDSCKATSCLARINEDINIDH